MTSGTTTTTTIQVSSSDLKEKGNRLDKEAIVCGNNLFTNGIRLKEIALERAYDMEELIKRGELHFPVDVIYSVILINYRKNGMPRAGIDHVIEVFSAPEFDKYKSGVYDRNKRVTPANKLANNIVIEELKPKNSVSEKERLVNEGEKIAVDSQVNGAWGIVEQNLDHPLIKD